MPFRTMWPSSWSRDRQLPYDWREELAAAFLPVVGNSVSTGAAPQIFDYSGRLNFRHLRSGLPAAGAHSMLLL